MQNEIPQRWKAFLHDLDDSLEKETEIVCIGGFVIAIRYHLDRETSDLDFINCFPVEAGKNLLSLAGEGSPLHRKHRVYLQHVTVAQTTECYEDRLSEMFPGEFKFLRLYTLDTNDLALTKLLRNSEKDREDILRLVGNVEFDIEVFKARYETEFKVYVEDNRHSSTFDFWLRLISESAEKAE